jgi:DNA-binding CsgD family transcriptional regulator
VAAENELAGLIETAPSEAHRAQATLIRLENLTFALGRGQLARRLADEAGAWCSDASWKAEIAATRAGVLLVTDGFREAGAAAERVMKTGTGRALMLASLVAAMSLTRMGRIEAGLDALASGAEATRSSHRPLDWYPWFSDLIRCEAMAHAGRFDEAEVLARREYTRSLEDHSTERRAFFAWIPTKAVLERGDVDIAIGRSREAAALFRQLGRSAFERHALVPLALSLALAGRAREADQVLVDIDALPAEPALSVAVDLGEARGMAARASGRVAEARRLLAETADLGERIGDLVRAASALHMLGRLGDPREHLSRLRDIAGAIEGRLAHARVAHVSAIAAGDAEAMDRVSAEFEGMGAFMLATFAAVDASRVWGRDNRAAVSLVRASELASRCGGSFVPELEGADRRVRLTPAETQAALLVAGGRSNREVADTLHLSVRTVENRLQRIYEKLGLTSRAELAELFAGGGPGPGG